MKTWITYPAAILLGFSAHMLLGGWGPYETLLDVVVPYARELGLFILFPVVFVLFASATASLRRYKDTAVVFSSTILWGLFTTLLLSFSGMALALVLPNGLAGFAAASPAMAAERFFDFSMLGSLFVSRNAFAQFTASDITLLPVMILALLAGIALRPDKEAIRPAYVTLNSFAEAMLRLSRLFTIIVGALLMFISADWFRTAGITQLLTGSAWYLLGLLIAAVAAVIVIIPLFFVLLSLLKGGNPFRVLLGVFPALLASGFSGSLLFGATPLIALSQHNAGNRKRVAGISVPILTIIGRGGSAMIATFTIIHLILAMGASSLSMRMMVFIALFSALFSFASSFSPSFEVPFIIMMVLKGIDVRSADLAVGGLLVLLPVISLASLVIDAAAVAFGSTFSSRIVSPDDRVPLDSLM